jgi:hypothetical protein
VTGVGLRKSTKSKCPKYKVEYKMTLYEFLSVSGTKVIGSLFHVDTMTVVRSHKTGMG